MKSYTLQSITLLIGSDWWFQATPTICLPLGVTTYPFLRAGHKQMWSPATYILAIINTPFIIYSYGSYGFMSHIWWYSDTPISNHSHNIISNHPIIQSWTAKSCAKPCAKLLWGAQPLCAWNGPQSPPEAGPRAGDVVAGLVSPI